MKMCLIYKIVVNLNENIVINYYKMNYGMLTVK